MRTILGLLAVLAVTVVSVSAVEAEIKSTTKLTVSSVSVPGRLTAITDPRVLVLSNVFAGNFIGEAADTPNRALARYTLSFDIQTREGVKTEAYVVHYGVDRSTGQAFVYLPGRGEPSYRRNVSTILREGQDGRWHRASTEWSQALAPHLK
jgi:hypothetical protein